VFFLLSFITAPYGRYTRRGWGPVLSDRWGWLVMEAPSAILFFVFFAAGRNRASVVSLVFLALWELHYIYRAFVFPLGMRGREKHMPLAVIAMAIAFNAGNCYINGRYLFEFAGAYGVHWLQDVRFLAGLVMFLTGYIIHMRADAALRALRAPGANGYSIPRRGLYQWISCPNYFGEIVEWAGWAVATWSVPGAAFAVWTIANLAPRALAHHRWYRTHFDEYPAGRKALVPGVL
jgi:hypothetical protein